MSEFPPPTAPEPTPVVVEPRPSWWKRRLWKLPAWAWIVIGVLVLGGIAGAVGGEEETNKADDAAESTSPSPASTDVAATDEPEITPEAAEPIATESPATTAAAPTATAAPTTSTSTTTTTTTSSPPVQVTVQPVAPEPNLTASQQSAIRSAESYLDLMGFSRQGLIDQLSSEFGDQFSVADATFAVDSLNVDWSAEAVESAESYLDLMGFSRQGLIDQLSSEFGDQFTVDQATFAVDGLSVDWNAEAVESATSYLDLMGFSCQGLIDQLSSDFGDQFTVEQATHAAAQVGLC